MSILLVRRRGKEIRRFSMHGNIITVGRDSVNSRGGPDLSLPDTSRRVSRFHAVIVRDRRGFYLIRDLASANGTFVNGSLVYGKRLQESDRIGIGDFELRYSEREQVAADLSQAVRVVMLTPAGREKSEKTALADIPPENLERISEGFQQILHDILQRLRLLPEDADLYDELLSCLASAVDARRGVIAEAESPFHIVPEAIFGIDVENGEQMGIAREYVRQVLTDGNALVASFAGSAVMCSPLRLGSDRRGIIYLECDRSRCFTEENRVFLDLICRRLPEFLREQSESGESSAAGAERFEWDVDMVAKSPEMRDIVAEIDRCTDTDSNVLLRGPTGTGKEITARTIHAQSARSTGPFIPVELSTLEREMVSSVLFGWTKGSYTGADRNSEGAFQQARGGTIYLDEIGDISHEIQIKLRRAVEEKEVFPVGSASGEHVDVKVIAATNVDLDRAVADGAFRDDLLLRFGRQIELPPLKNRRTDIPILTYFFIDQMQTNLRAVSHGAMRMLLDYDWPGNVRELRELIKEVAGRGKEIIFSFDLPERVRQAGSDADESGVSTIQETERREIIKVLNMVNWNKTRASEILGYGSKQTLYNKIEKYNIIRPAQGSLESD